MSIKKDLDSINNRIKNIESILRSQDKKWGFDYVLSKDSNRIRELEKLITKNIVSLGKWLIDIEQSVKGINEILTKLKKWFIW